jgi:hypothetical protein
VPGHARNISQNPALRRDLKGLFTVTGKSRVVD